MTLELTAALGTWIAPAILVALVPLFAGILRGFEERLSRRLDDLGRPASTASAAPAVSTAVSAI